MIRDHKWEKNNFMNCICAIHISIPFSFYNTEKCILLELGFDHETHFHSHASIMLAKFANHFTDPTSFDVYILLPLRYMNEEG